METKPLVFGIIGFILGGLLVSVAATTFDKAEVTGSDETMSQMTDQLRNKDSDSYDKAFIENMIMHHQAAVDMAKLSQERAKHAEIKQLSSDIISAQEKEISQMKDWQQQWGYSSMQMMH
jgi:uncharacterized protein (DUF305 family)